MSALVVVVFYFLFFVMSVVLHECAHGWMALRAGDQTAAALGRLTLNPIKHIDPFWTILMPILMLWASRGRFALGGAKPVPINPRNFRDLRRDDLMVSAAGVATNGLIAVVCVIPLHLDVFGEGTVGMTVLGMTAITNLYLMVFNLVPIPPLDGSHILKDLLPYQAAAWIDRIGQRGVFLIIILLVFFRLGLVLSYVVFFVWNSMLRMPAETTQAIFDAWHAGLSDLF